MQPPLNTELWVVLGKLLSRKAEGVRERQCWSLFGDGGAVSEPLQPGSCIPHGAGSDSLGLTQGPAPACWAPGSCSQDPWWPCLQGCWPGKRRRHLGHRAQSNWWGAAGPLQRGGGREEEGNGAEQRLCAKPGPRQTGRVAGLRGGSERLRASQEGCAAARGQAELSYLSPTLPGPACPRSLPPVGVVPAVGG